MSTRVNRRAFLKRSAAGAGLVLLTGSAAVRAYAANSKLHTALIGTGGRGAGHLGPAAGENLLALCDVDEGRMAKAREKAPHAKTYTDWRQLYDQHKDLNLVFVATPDHTHFPAAYSAVTRGFGCYCEKPLTHSIWEARTLAEAVRQKKVPTQMGNQGHANEGNRRIVEWVRAGVLGAIREIHTWTNRPVWPQGQLGPFREAPVPANLNWDAWLGVAPQRPYLVNEKGESPLHPFKWRGWFDYGCGAVGDMGCHTWDCVWWSMDPRAPLSAEPIRVVDLGTETFPRQMIVKWEFGPSVADAPFQRPAFTAFWYEGGLKPPVPDEIRSDPTRKKKELPPSGSLFIGEKGKLLVEGDYSESPRLIPQARMEEFKAGAMRTIARIPQSIGHHEELLVACRGEQPWDYPKSNFLYGGPLVEAMLLANVSVRLGQKIAWDPETLRCPGCPKADGLLRRPYRKSFWDI